MPSYLAITPVRDEELFLPDLIDSMRSQTILPSCWIIVDDGSTDKSAEIIDKAALKYSWIKARHLSWDGNRKPGGESIIMRFLPRELLSQFEFIARFDADLIFGSDYIELLLKEFARDDLLGIASGCLIEQTSRGWEERITPAYHTRGPSKFYSRECFAAINGLEAGLGWDTIDEARAMMAGFHTRNFRNIKAFHRRMPGSARGLWRGRMDAGRAAFAAGYAPSFMIARTIRCSFWPRPSMAGALTLAGFFSAMFDRDHRLADREVVRFIRKQQRRRLMLRSSLWQ